MNDPINDSKPLVFFDYPSSPCARRVRISLFEKKLPHQIELVDLGRQEQKSAAFRQINPWGKVPALVHRGCALWESNVITQYLDEAFAGPRLYPADWRTYAQVRYWQDFELYFAQRFFMLMYQRVAGLGLRIAQDFADFHKDMQSRSQDPAFIDFMCRAYRAEVLSEAECIEAEQFLLAVAAHLESSLADGRPYLSGTSFGQADISVFPRLRMFKLLSVSLKPFPLTSAWIRRLEKRPSVKQAQSASEKMLSHPAIPWVLAWADKALRKPIHARSPLQRLGLRALRKKMVGDQIASDRRRAAQHNQHIQGRTTLAAEPLLALTPQQVHIELHGCSELPEVSGLLQILDALSQPYTHHEIPLLASDRVSGGKPQARQLYRFPAITVEDTAVCGLAPILDVLSRIHPQAHTLMPVDPYLRARARIWIAGDADGEQKYLRDALDQWHLGTALADQDEQIAERQQQGLISPAQAQRISAAIEGDLCTDEQLAVAETYLHKRYQEAEHALEQGQGWLVGGQYSLADAVESRRLLYLSQWSSVTLPSIVQSWADTVSSQLQTAGYA